MKIAVFGGTGRVGSSFIQMATENGHTIRALVRDHEKGQQLIPNAQLITGDATHPTDVQTTLDGCDAVFCSLGTDKTTTLSNSIPLISKAMEEQGITRIITLGTAGILNSRYENGKYRYQSSESKRTKTFAAEEHVKAYKSLESSAHQWTVVCPTYLPDGEEEGNIRYEVDLLPIDGKKITTQDTARFALLTLEKEWFLQQRVGICY